MNLEDLKKPFPPEKISWRIGATFKDTKKNKDFGMALAYIDARDVMDRLDEVCGAGFWGDSYKIYGPWKVGDKDFGPRVICSINIVGDFQNEDNAWTNINITKSDGAGDTDYEAEKGAISDAFKRAAVKFGIGRYLYSLKNIWVELEKKRDKFVIKESETPKLIASLPRPDGKQNKPAQKATLKGSKSNSKPEIPDKLPDIPKEMEKAAAFCFGADSAREDGITFKDWWELTGFSIMGNIVDKDEKEICRKIYSYFKRHWPEPRKPTTDAKGGDDG